MPLQILSVGLDDCSMSLPEHGLFHLKTNSGMGALLVLRDFNPDVVLVRWVLPDMSAEALLKRIITTKPSIASIAVIDTDNTQQEIAARSIGAAAVINCGVSGQTLYEIIMQLYRHFNVRAG
ncbi:MAG: response regulator [Phycisphaerae bacterium]